jgi:transglutaminase-like putative cysteine protease
MEPGNTIHSAWMEVMMHGSKRSLVSILLLIVVVSIGAIESPIEEGFEHFGFIEESLTATRASYVVESEFSFSVESKETRRLIVYLLRGRDPVKQQGLARDRQERQGNRLTYRAWFLEPGEYRVVAKANEPYAPIAESDFILTWNITVTDGMTLERVVREMYPPETIPTEADHLANWNHDYSAVDRIAAECPEEYERDMAILANWLIEQVDNDRDRFRVIATWIARNIEYDLKARMYSVNEVFTKRRAVCGGYSALYAQLCRLAGLDCRYVSGLMPKGIIKGKRQYEPHAWNMIKVDGVWYHCDVTWFYNKFRDEMNELVFMAIPEGFYFSHIPEWQEDSLLSWAVGTDRVEEFPGLLEDRLGNRLIASADMRKFGLNWFVMENRSKRFTSDGLFRYQLKARPGTWWAFRVRSGQSLVEQADENGTVEWEYTFDQESQYVVDVMASNKNDDYVIVFSLLVTVQHGDEQLDNKENATKDIHDKTTVEKTTMESSVSDDGIVAEDQPVPLFNNFEPVLDEMVLYKGVQFEVGCTAAEPGVQTRLVVQDREGSVLLDRALKNRGQDRFARKLTFTRPGLYIVELFGGINDELVPIKRYEFTVK